MYFYSYFNDNISNIKRTWQGINMIITNKKKNQKSISAIKDPITNHVTRDKSKMCNILNKHFASIGQRLASNISESNSSFSDYLSHIDQSKSFLFIPITKEEIESEIMLIPNNKSHGLYSCPTSILKCAKHYLSGPIADLFNLSVHSGVYPSKLKLAKVTSIFKSDDDLDPNNYRPISLLSIFNRIFENIMYSPLGNFYRKIKIY